MGRPQPRLRLCASFSLALMASVATVLLSGCSLTGEHLSRWLPRPGVHVRPDQAQEAPAERTDRAGHSLDLMPTNGGRSTPAPRTDSIKPPTRGTSEVTQASPNGQWLATTTSSRASGHVLSIRRSEAARSARAASEIKSAQPPVAVTWAPDSSRLAFLRRDARNRTTWQVWLVDPVSGKSAQFSTAVGGSTPSLAWFPDSRRLAVGTEGWLTMADTETGSLRAIALPEGRPIAGALAVSPDGQSVVLAMTRGGVWVASAEDGKLSLVADETDVDSVAWAPGGREIAVRTASDGRWRVRVVRK